MLLQSLTNDEIISRTRRLARRERSTTLLVLLHLNEIERRKLHLELGYRSMFAFCTSALGYAESTAGRHIQAARCIARVPEVYGLLASNAVNVVTVSQVSRILNAENKDELLVRISGRSQGEVDAIVAEYRPRSTAPRDRVQPLAVRTPAPARMEPSLLQPAPDLRPAVAMTCTSASVTSESRNDSDRESECENAPHSRNHHLAGATATAEPPAEEYVKFSFAASTRLKNRLDRVRSLAWHRLPANASLEHVFELLVDEFIERHDPSIRHERREERCTRVPVASKVATDEAPSGRRRHIAASVRDEVFHRDDGRCAFIGRNGRRCGSTHALQVDHIHPVALGGEGTIENLRLLCAQHNRFEAERLLSNAGIGTASRGSVKHRL